MAIINIPTISSLQLIVPPNLMLLSLLFVLFINGGECAQLMSRHVQFLKSSYDNGGRRHLGCARNASVCSDPVKNPNGGATCCFNTFCKDLTSDPLHCGRCDNTCPYGSACCGGFCVDIRNDRMHCGNCFFQCPMHEKCFYGGTSSGLSMS